MAWPFEIISFVYDLDFLAHFWNSCCLFKDLKDLEVLRLFGEIRGSESPRILVRMLGAMHFNISEIFGRAVFVSSTIFYVIYFFLVSIMLKINIFH